MDVLQNGNFLLCENLSAVFLGDHRALVLGILHSCGLCVASNARDLYLNFLRVLAHGVDVLLCFGIGLSLPFDLILHHLGLLLHYLPVIEGILYPPHFELRVSEPGSEAVSLLVGASPLLLRCVESPSECLNLIGST